ncbi:regulator of chromosome condensation 1/beta-lactamase-inhibitor protein II [Lasiosphaeria miniovina]|uniref:Regulator of chromosome condensation 1/beta-lactamase-inhibitor protein II n=1 Tax=Lasiosphaeria miniovina TaxID=1954250 RepID=A0AA40A045_9PEZI|nr:regulator of chromosome condensation 1/beta-lactamase-inhibitor protein II [Lasiosphaeria miniovina]KAK0706784.1 regulator of chromosome condensation 1/beta-lactamase-inhibitor protein II [Lasiosphaeria miniovina]
MPQERAQAVSLCWANNWPHLAEACNGVVVGITTTTTFSGFHNITQLVSFATGFAALSASGRVWTWGDARFGACLGRETSTSPHHSPAEMPGAVEDVLDLPTGRIVRLAAGGYVVAALTAGNDLYVWGQGHPGGRPLPVLEGLTDRPAPVDIQDNDIVDVAVGDAHLVALTTEGQVFVIGDNSNGQLGLPVKAVDSWRAVSSVPGGGTGQSVVGVAAGPQNSFLMVRS